MKLLTKEILDAAPALGATTGNPSSIDAKIIAKFFTPWSSWTWYMTELDPETKEAFGLVVGHEIELGYFNIDELESIKGPGGITIERDLYFGEHTLAEMMERESRL